MKREVPSSLKTVLFSFAVVVAFLLQTDSNFRGALMLYVFCLVLSFAFFTKTERLRRKSVSAISEYLFALIFTVSTLLGEYLDRGWSLSTFGMRQCLKFLFCVLVFTEIARRLLRLLYELLYRWACREESLTAPTDAQRSQGARRDFFLAFTVIMLCWLPVWLAYYPGLWNYDPWQVEQVMDNAYSKHHPLIHTLLLGYCYKFGVDRGSANLGLMLYDAIQSILCAGIFACTYAFLRKNTKSRIFTGLTLAFFALFPVNSVMAISTTKDVLFSAFILLALLLGIQLVEGQPKRIERRMLVAETLLLTLIMLLRNNAQYCIYGCILLCLLHLKKRPWRGMLAMLLAGTVLFLMTDTALTRVLNAEPGPIREMLSIPSQQFARINHFQLGEEDPETAELISEFFAFEEDIYVPACADRAKKRIQVEKPNQIPELLEASAKLFRKYPTVSVDSFLYTTRPLWYLGDTSNAYIYKAYGYGYLSAYVEESYGIEPDSKFPALRQLFEQQFTQHGYEKIPVLSLLYSPALYIWLFLFCVQVMMGGKQRRMLIPVPFFLFLILTMIPGPCIIIRYVYPYVVCAPIFLWMAMRAGIRDV